MLDHWRSFQDVVNAIELQIDSAGDTLYNLTANYGSPAEDRIRWANETHDALVTACDGLHALARVAEEVRSSNRERVIRDQQIATAGVNASGDTEERKLAPDPQHTPAVASEPKDAA